MGDAIGDAVDRVVRLVLEALEDVLVVRDQVEVDRCDGLRRDQPQRRVAGGGDAVVVARLHQRHHLVGAGADLRVDLATRLLLERRHPVLLDVARPVDEIDLALVLRLGLDLLERRAEPFDLRARRARVVTAAARRHYGERRHEQDENGPQAEALLSSGHAGTPSRSTIADSCSGRQASRTRRPSVASTSVEVSSRFWVST